MHKILLVEDDENSYDMLMDRLEHRGYEVSLATTGEEALDTVEREAFSLILMDIRLPGFDGYEATQRIRERSGDGAAVPIIALTAHALEEDRGKALSAGCDDYHAKPVHFSKLLEQMEALLEADEIESEEA